MFYDFDMPVKIVVGEGCSAQLGESLSTAEVKKEMGMDMSLAKEVPHHATLGQY